MRMMSLYLIFIHSLILVLSLSKLVKGMGMRLGFNKSIENKNIMKCIESERQSLLSFKNGIIDSHNNNNKIGSWGNNEEEECCNWSGIECNNITYHIISLNLRGSSHDSSSDLRGNIDFSSLINLTQLTHLDLSSNSFFDVPILEFIGYLTNLNYLNLSYNFFVGSIHFHVANLSKLSVLDLRSNSYLVVNNNDLGWLFNLSSLKYLDLSGVQFSNGDSDYWATVIHKLPLLHTLFLSNCRLPQPKLMSYTNSSTFLSHLDLSSNDFNSSIYPWLFTFTHNLVHLKLAFNDFQGPIPHELKNMVSLSFLDLSHNQFQGFIPDDLFKNMASLSYLDLSSNNLQGSIPNDISMLTSLVHLDLGSNNFVVASPKSFENLCHLKTLSLAKLNMRGLISAFLIFLPQCVHNSLQYLNLASNEFIGSLPSFTMFPSLKGLDLSNNTLNGTIPLSFGQLSNLEYLVLSHNSLEGEVSEAHFSNLSKLRELNLSGNSLILKFKSNWVPPFHLDAILLRSCKLGPLFPNWLQTQNFTYLDLSLTQISDTIPHWFWTNLSPNLYFLDLSGNKIKGEIPNLTIKFKGVFIIFLNSNEFVGQVPPFLLQPQVGLDLSDNKFSNMSSLCGILHDTSSLFRLDLSSNQFSGQLPDCWDRMPDISILSLANNSFFGDVPRSMANLTQLRYLNLHNNQFSGEWSCGFNFTELQVLDAMSNNLSGTIPSCIGSRLPNLVRLNLKSNNFDGNLPSSLCKLENIQVLDISSNSITGTIPTCINNFKALTNRYETRNADYSLYFSLGTELQFIISYAEEMVMVWKGEEQFIKGKVLQFVKSIDLSSNQLTGEIPNEITTLVGLISFNLSMNNLTGRIPDQMGQLQSLESLDLSRNRLYGPIPSNLSKISTLNTLNLSYNNLAGKIPTGTQLQSFNASSYEGNFYLCGAPLQKCSQEEVQDPSINPIPVENRDEDGFIMRELLISMAAGFVVGFWGIFGSLILNRKWRHAYFNFVANIIERVTCN